MDSDNFESYRDQDYTYDNTETVSDISSLKTSSTDTFPKRKQGSEIWNFFEKVQWGKEEDKKTAKCKLAKCEKVFSLGVTGTTKPLWRHLENSHHQTYVKTEEFQKKKQKILTSNQSIKEMIEVSLQIYVSEYSQTSL